MFRLYPGPWDVDIDDCKIVHWLEYMLYIGVSHFYLYDNSKSTEEEERADRYLKKYFNLKMATRIKWDGDILGQDYTIEMQAYNDAAFSAYNDKALVPCERCGRTFLPDRLEVSSCTLRQPYRSEK